MCDMIHLPPGPLRAANRSYRLGTRAHTLRVPGPAIGDGTGGSSSYRFRAGNAFSDTRPGSALRETRQRLVCRPSGTRRCRDVSYSTARRCRLPVTVAAATRKAPSPPYSPVRWVTEVCKGPAAPNVAAMQDNSRVSCCGSPQPERYARPTSSGRTSPSLKACARMWCCP